MRTRYDCEKINIVRQKFVNWLPHADEDDNMYWAVVDGRKCSVCETDGFVKWLNERYCANGSKAYIVTQHVQVDDRYDTIEF